MKTIKPSRTRAIGPYELAFMLGNPIGDFAPEPFYLDNVEPAELPFVPDIQHGGRSQVERIGPANDAAPLEPRAGYRHGFTQVAPGAFVHRGRDDCDQGCTRKFDCECWRCANCLPDPPRPVAAFAATLGTLLAAVAVLAWAITHLAHKAFF